MVLGASTSQAVNVPTPYGDSFTASTGFTSIPCRQVDKSLLASIKNEKLAQYKLDLAKEQKFIKTVSNATCAQYLYQVEQANREIVKADVISIGQEITAIVSDYISFGKSNATDSITLTNLKAGGSQGTLTFGKMTNATGTGIAVASGPQTTVSDIRLSTGSHLSSGNYGAGPTANWCIVVSSFDKIVQKYYSAQYTNKGLGATLVGKTVLTCHHGI